MDGYNSYGGVVMKKILITGATGQIGTELTMKLRHVYGADHVVASSRKKYDGHEVVESGPFEVLDVLDFDNFLNIAKKYEVDTVIHLAAFLSATAEEKPLQAWKLNMDGLINGLEVARIMNTQFFSASSIGAFGPSTPKVDTPQETIQRPNTMYGINKVSGELLCDYYYNKYGVDTRSLRFPGLISSTAMPGGGTTDYAVHIFYEALKNKAYTSYLKEDTYLDMMYMPDAINAIIKLMEAKGDHLKYRNAYNVSSMSICPKDLYLEIKKHIPDFIMDYEINTKKQKIAESWPDKMNISQAESDWGFRPVFDLSAMTQDMLSKLKRKI